MNQLKYVFTGGLAEISWENPRESSKTDSVEEDKDVNTKFYELIKLNVPIVSVINVKASIMADIKRTNNNGEFYSIL